MIFLVLSGHGMVQGFSFWDVRSRICSIMLFLVQISGSAVKTPPMTTRDFKKRVGFCVR